METNLTISIIDECLKNTDSECEDILKTKEALNVLKQEKYEINEEYKKLDIEINNKKEKLINLQNKINNTEPTLNQKQAELSLAISNHSAYKSELGVAESENCWRHSPGRYDQNCLDKKENLKNKVNHWSHYKSKYQNEKDGIRGDIEKIEEQKREIDKEIAALQTKATNLNANEYSKHLNELLDGVMRYQPQEDLNEINHNDPSSNPGDIDITYQN